MDSVATNSSVGTSRKIRPFVYWSVAGAGCLLLQIYIYTSWILSPDFRPTHLGADPIPQSVRSSTYSQQISGIIFVVLISIWFAYGVRKTRTINTPRAMVIAWLCSWWLDPFLDFLRPMFTYNAYAVNFGCWCEHIPFWQSPMGSRIAEPLLIVGPSYLLNFTLTSYMALWVMKRAKKYRPQLNNFGMAFVGFAAVWCTYSLLDLASTQYLYVDAWPGAFRHFSISGGSPDQFPIYEFILFPSIFVACAFLLFYADADGHTVIERGITQVRGAEWRRSGLRVLAFIAFCNLLNVTYTGAMGIHALAADPWPAGVPSWLADEQCGAYTGVACQLAPAH